MERGERLLREILGERAEYAIAGLDERDARFGGVDLAEVVLKTVVGDLRQRAGELHAGRPAADDREVEQRAADFRIVFGLCLLERRIDATADISGVFDRFEARRVLGPFIAAKVAVARPGGDDEIIVMNVALRRVDALQVEIEADHLGEHHLAVRVAREDPTERRRDVRRRQTAGCHLVEERLKEMEVAPIDKHDVDRRALERFDRVQPGEPAPDNDDAGTGRSG